MTPWSHDFRLSFGKLNKIFPPIDVGWGEDLKMPPAIIFIFFAMLGMSILSCFVQKLEVKDKNS